MDFFNRKRYLFKTNPNNWVRYKKTQNVKNELKGNKKKLKRKLKPKNMKKYKNVNGLKY